MSKRRASKRRKGVVPKHLRKYLFKKKRGGGKKRRRARRSSTAIVRRRKGHSMAKRRRKQHRRSRRRHHGGGGGRGGWIPPREDLHLFAASAGVGYLESAAAADANHVLNKIPRPVAQLGYTGGTALAAWVIAKMTGNKWARLVARASATIATYQMGRHGGLLTDASKAVTISGDDYLGDDDYMGAESYIDDATMGALDAEGDSVSGVPFEDSVFDALESA